MNEPRITTDDLGKELTWLHSQKVSIQEIFDWMLQEFPDTWGIKEDCIAVIPGIISYSLREIPEGKVWGTSRVAYFEIDFRERTKVRKPLPTSLDLRPSLGKFAWYYGDYPTMSDLIKAAVSKFEFIPFNEVFLKGGFMSIALEGSPKPSSQ